MSTSRPELNTAATTEETKKPFIINIDGSEEVVSEKVFQAFRQLNQSLKLATFTLMMADLNSKMTKQQSHANGNEEEGLAALLSALSSAEKGRDKPARKPSLSGLFGGRSSSSSSSDSEEGPGFNLSEMLSKRRPF